MTDRLIERLRTTHGLVRLCAWILWVCVVGTSLGAAQEIDRHAALILRVLSYDRSIAQRASDRVNVLVVYQPGDRASEEERSRLLGAINQLGARTTVANLPARAVEHAFHDAAALRQAARPGQVAAIYVCSGLGAAHGVIGDIARAVPTLTLTADADAVRRGLAVALAAEGGQIRLIVNLPASEAQGARLDAALLRLAQVIR